MATVGLYGTSLAGATPAVPSAESTGLYGQTTTFGGTYFEWLIFKSSANAPVTPTGGSWNFETNSGTAPTGWLTAPPVNPTLPTWMSIALVNSRAPSTLTWTTPSPIYRAGPTGPQGSGIQINGSVATPGDLPASAPPGSVYFVESTRTTYIFGA